MLGCRALRIVLLLGLEVACFIVVVSGVLRLLSRPSAAPGVVASTASGARPSARFVPSLPRRLDDELIRPATDARGTFLGMSDELLLKRLKDAQVKTVRFNKGGSSISCRIDFADGSRASFKPTQTNPQSVPRKEAAAYRIGRLLGLSVIAPALLRPLSQRDLFSKLHPDSEWARDRLERETLFDERGETVGALMYWIPQVVDLHLDTTDGILTWAEQLSQEGATPPERAPLLAQLSTLLLFDLLQNNYDRFSGGNLLGSPDGRTLYFMDNAIGFQTDADGHQRCWSYLKRAQRFSRRFVSALRRLERPALVEALRDPGGSLLTDEELDALMARRDRALRYVDRLIDQYGEPAVLAFP